MRWSLALLALALLLGGSSALGAAKKKTDGKPEAKPAATKPAEAKPAEAKPVAKPAEAKPAEAKPAEGKPATFSPEAIEHFEKHVRPVLVAHCQKCHDAKESEAGLRLDSRAAALAGGDGGVVIVPGEPERSRFIKAIRYDGDLQMPPDAKLAPEAVEALTAWVKAGAAWPAEQPAGAAAQTGVTSEAIAKIRGEHWAFRPVQNPPEPPVKDSKWPAGAIDRFVLAKLEAAGMTPAPPADRRTLLRRASLDLTGLPPSYEEIAAFENDASSDAWPRAVDRLLASPHYGERWGRYWLDIARYADTKGYVFQEERRYPFSYTYRDYVIRAFNEDLPYDRFLMEQLAADRLNLGEDKRPLAAMGFLTLGRRFLNNQHDIIDDRIDVVMRGTQGLTVACARCHDHKFDPIPIKDYYSLYGIFASSNEPKDPPQIAVPEKTPQFEAYAKELKKREDAVTALLEKQRVEKLAKDPKADVAGDKIEKLLDRPVKNQVRDLRKKIEQWRATSPAAPQHAMVLVDNAQPSQPRVFKRGNPGSPGDSVPRQYLEVLSPERKPFADGSGRLELAKAIASRDNPLTARVMANRVWMYHFGKPLVDTPSDFGLRSEKPSHPELLDWLAWRLMEDGWSLKKLHRQMMLSNAYQQSSQIRPEYVARDPENRLLSHYNRRRLDFEATRDSLLAASGRLDETLFGKSVELSAQPFTTRRTVYGFIDRQNIDPLFRTFDFASPDSTSPQRFATTVPQQALFMLNSPFVIEQARHLLARPEVAEASQPADKITALYQLAYGRKPTAREIELGLAFTGGTPGPAVPLVQAPKVWQYGYGEFDDAAGKLKTFKPLPHFTGQSYQGGTKLPDDKLGWVLLTSGGGHPGNNAAHAAVRRWIAPRDATISIAGKLTHPEKNGDGVRARISSSRTGKVGEWSAHKSEANTEVATLEVKQGDVLDFVVDCKGSPDFDSFGWAPVVRIAETGAAGAGAVAAAAGPVEWNAEAGFSGPDGAPPAAPLGPWDRYAQVLLLANELVFVD